MNRRRKSGVRDVNSVAPERKEGDAMRRTRRHTSMSTAVVRRLHGDRKLHDAVCPEHLSRVAEAATDRSERGAVADQTNFHPTLRTRRVRNRFVRLVAYGLGPGNRCSDDNLRMVKLDL